MKTRLREYQELKTRIHQELLNRLNLEHLTRVRREDAEPEIRALIVELIGARRKRPLLSLAERENLRRWVTLNERSPDHSSVAPRSDISDILVNRFDRYIEPETAS
jgi:hypothetical protein